MKYMNLKPEHVKEASTIVAQSFKKMRDQLPLLPDKYEDDENITPMIESIHKNYPGIAAIEKRQLAGFIMGISIPNFKGIQRGVYCPIWAHGANMTYKNRDIYQQLYRYISELWVENDCFTHAITLYSSDKESIDAWFWNGFGLLVVDAIRSIEPVKQFEIANGIEIRKANIKDLKDFAVIREKHRRYMAGGSCFLPFIEHNDRNFMEYYSNWLKKEGNVLWLAFKGNMIVGYLHSHTDDNENPFLNDGFTLDIGGTHVLPDYRGRGIATSLLNTALSWGREVKMKRCSVDFESMNIYGSRFWLRYFKPFCYNVIRRIDERVAWGRGDRDVKNMF